MDPKPFPPVSAGISTEQLGVFFIAFDTLNLSQGVILSLKAPRHEYMASKVVLRKFLSGLLSFSLIFVSLLISNGHSYTPKLQVNGDESLGFEIGD